MIARGDIAERPIEANDEVCRERRWGGIAVLLSLNYASPPPQTRLANSGSQNEVNTRTSTFDDDREAEDSNSAIQQSKSLVDHDAPSNAMLALSYNLTTVLAQSIPMRNRTPLLPALLGKLR
jgi:hypothetical protein